MKIRPSVIIFALSFLVLGVFGSVWGARAQEGTHLTINRIDSSAFPSVTTYLTVTDATGLPIQNLEADVFSVSEDGQPVDNILVSEVQDSNEPVRVVLAIDTSGSMTTQELDSHSETTTALGNTQEAAIAFVEALADVDQVGLVTFSDQADEIVSLTDDKPAIMEAIGQLSAQGETALYDSIVASVGMLKNLPPGRKAIILLADGRNNSSTFTFGEAINEAARWSIPIYPIGFGNIDTASMEKIASLTGGYSQVKPDSSELQQAFDTVLQVLRQQYVLEFSSIFPADGKEHTLTVNLNHQGTQFQDSHTYIATPGEVVVGFSGLADGDIVGGDVRIILDLLAPAPIREVSITLDGAKLSTLVDEPFEYIWDSTAVADGDHLLEVTAEDEAGNIGSFAVHLVVQPPISVEWTNPVDGGDISGQETLTVNIDSLAGIAKVEFYLDQELIEAITEPPYELEWTAEGVDPGDHSFKALAIDVNNQSAESEIGVRVALRNTSLILVLAMVILIGGAIIMIPLANRRRKRIAGARARQQATKLPSMEGKDVGLQELDGLQPGHTWELGEEEIRIGRRKAENDIPVAGRSASRRHAVIQRSEDQYILHDLNPANPSLVNGQPVQGQHTLSQGDTIQIGESTFKFEILGEKQGEERD